MGKADNILVLGAIAVVTFVLISKNHNLCETQNLEPINPKPFYRPIDIALDATEEHLFVISWGETSEEGTRILKINLKTHKVDNLGSKASPPFKRSTGVAVDKEGNVYVADTDNKLVRKIDVKTDIVTNLGGNTEFTPVGIEVDDNGNVYVSDYGNDTIRKITPSGEVSTLEASANPGFNGIQSLALDDNGNVYVVDSNNNVVRKINAKDKSVKNIEFSDNVPLNSPIGVAISCNGSYVYVADSGNKLVRKIDVAKKTIKNLGDTKFGSCTNIVVDKKGNVYVTDTVNKSVRRIDARTGKVTDV
jgi:DNA-binding beta-propeller fold protein YncE